MVIPLRYLSGNKNGLDALSLLISSSVVNLAQLLLKKCFWPVHETKSDCFCLNSWTMPKSLKPR